MARVAAIIVTWNRKGFVTDVLNALSRQTFPIALLDVVVIDNAGTDGTFDHLLKAFSPERVVMNPTDAAERPAFRDDESHVSRAANTLGFNSLTIVRNSANLGGCGGFNTGFGYIDQQLARARGARPDWVWLVDDDIDLPSDTLEHLARTLAAGSDIGLVGSRTVDIRSRTRTIETTIYYNTESGAMQDDAPLDHPRRAEFEAWIKQVGSTKGEQPFTGIINVDVVSACSMLARWDAVGGPASAVAADDSTRQAVGFWDARYFIYCDDADWCLRFAKHGWRVVLALDAVVYHTPWNLKLTPARIYYANRNRIWMGQKALPPAKLRAVTRRAIWSILRDALRASLHRRAFHADIILNTARDVVINRAGKTGSDGPPAQPLTDALRTAGVGPDSTVAVLCSHPDSLQWLQDLQARAEQAGLGSSAGVRWLPIVRNDVPGADAASLPPGAIVYGPRKRSRLKKQLAMLRARPSACIVFDQTNDFPILTPFGPSHNIHIDQKNPALAQLERDGLLVRARFLGRWLRESVRCLLWASRVKPFVRTSSYG
jgi:GT2 family glycosyltransferase